MLLQSADLLSVPRIEPPQPGAKGNFAFNCHVLFPMRLSDLNLAIVYVNLAHRDDRRAETEYQLAMQDLRAERQPGINAAWVRDTRGFQNERRYGCSLAKRLAIRRGMQTGADAVLLLEDDIVFHPEFHERLTQLELPEDWGLFYLGCRHLKRPEVVAPGLVRCRRATDNHAVLVRRKYYHQVIRGLAGKGRGAERTIPYSDTQLAGSQDIIPSYAAYPNLVWQGYSHSDTSGHPLTHYHNDGRQASHAGMLDSLDVEMQRVIRGEPPSPRLPESADSTMSGEDTPDTPVRDIPVVECVVVAWRAQNLERIIQAFRQQTIPCRITVITSGRMADDEPVPEEVLVQGDRVFRTSQEFGAFNRYIPSFVYESEFVYFHDDDMLPGNRLLEHFLAHARKLKSFGVLGQLGRRFILGEYNHWDVKRRDRVEAVDVVVRGYFMPARHLPEVLESIHLLGLKPGRDDLEDDLLLAWTMARLGLKCWVTPNDDDVETCMVRVELSPADARSSRGAHLAVRNAFLQKHWHPAWMVENIAGTPLPAAKRISFSP